MINIHYFKNINPFKTVLYNFKWFPFNIARHLPVFIGWNTRVRNLGRVVLDCDIHMGMINLGFPLGGFRNKNDDTFIDIRGYVIFKGRCSLGKGCKVIVDSNGHIEFGSNFNCTAGLNMESKKSIIFGDNCVLSWDVTILDTDFHPIYNEYCAIINPNRSVVIGNDVWIGYNCKIMKGTKVADNTIIASNTIVTTSITQSGVIIANEGNSQRILKSGISWKPADL